MANDLTQMNYLLLTLAKHLDGGCIWVRVKDITELPRPRGGRPDTFHDARTQAVKRAAFFGHIEVRWEKGKGRYIRLTERGIKHLAYKGLISEEKEKEIIEKIKIETALQG